MKPKYKPGQKVRCCGHLLIIDHWNDSIKEYVCHKPKDALKHDAWGCREKDLKPEGDE